MIQYLKRGLLVGAILLLPAVVWAAHPLITDDTGTQGQGKFQVEINGQYDSDKETVEGVSTKATGTQAAVSLSYGLTDNTDVVLGFPYQWAKVKEDGLTVFDEKGISDMTVDLKWRFFEKDGLSLAFRPGVRIPTGDDEKGLGAGRTGYQAFLIGTLEAAPWALHANVGYIGNENKADEEKNLWHASLAATCEVVKDLTIVANIGIERNPDKAASQDPAFVIGGLIYSFSENFDIDVGVKYGLNEVETDWSLLAGVAFRF